MTVYIMRLLRLAQETARAHLALAERSADRAGLTPAESRLLAALKDGATVSQLARRLGLTRQSVQRVADRLSEKKLARFTSNPDHQRSPLLTPTESGIRARERAMRELGDWEARLRDLVEPEELETAELALEALLSALES